MNEKREKDQNSHEWRNDFNFLDRKHSQEASADT
jgi:hypothetical protein